jgi:Na+/phosphate symporter
MARTLSQRWNRLRTTLTLQDLAVDVSGKILVGVGVGTLLAWALQPYAWILIIIGLVLSATIKAKYWKQFW